MGSFAPRGPVGLRYGFRLIAIARNLEAVESSKLSSTSTSGPCASTETNPSGVFQSVIVSEDGPAFAGWDLGIALLYRCNTYEA